MTVAFNVLGMGVYYGNERAWNEVSWGRVHVPSKSGAARVDEGAGIGGAFESPPELEPV